MHERIVQAFARHMIVGYQFHILVAAEIMENSNNIVVLVVGIKVPTRMEE